MDDIEGKGSVRNLLSHSDGDIRDHSQSLVERISQEIMMMDVLLCITTSIFSPRTVMEDFLDDVILTFHDGQTLEYKVTGITRRSMKSLNVNGESMIDHYRRKYGLFLQYPDFPCFETEDGHLIPPELAFYYEDSSD
jgi:hypothetical protein